MKKNFWPLLITCIAIAFIGITVWSVYSAMKGVSSVTDPEYYSHGLKYNSTSIETKAALALGWAIVPEVSENELKIKVLSSKKNDLVRNCSGEATFTSLSNNPEKEKGLKTGEEVTISFKEISPGIYSAALPPNLTRPLYASIKLSKNKATISRRLMINK